MICEARPCGHADICQCDMLGIKTTCTNVSVAVVFLHWPNGSSYNACRTCADKLEKNPDVLKVLDWASC